jgi:hypothetical protein
MDPQRIIDLCEANWDAHKSDCSGFVKAVASALQVTTFAEGDDADAVVDKLRAAVAAGAGEDWTALAPGDGPGAKAKADAGCLVIGGLKGADQANPDPQHGHVVVVVCGPLDRQYPTAYWGQLGGIGKKAMTINYAWRAGDRDRVAYFAKPLA